MHTTIAAQIRTAIKQSTESVYSLSKSVRVDEKSLRKFMAGKVGLSLPSLERLSDHLGLRLESDRLTLDPKGT